MFDRAVGADGEIEIEFKAILASMQIKHGVSLKYCTVQYIKNHHWPPTNITDLDLSLSLFE